MTDARETVAQICATRHLPYPERADRILSALEKAGWGKHSETNWQVLAIDYARQRDALQARLDAAHIATADAYNEAHKQITNALTSDKAVEAAGIAGAKWLTEHDDEYIAGHPEQYLRVVIAAAIQAQRDALAKVADNGCALVGNHKSYAGMRFQGKVSWRSV